MRIAIIGTVHKPIKKDATGGTEVFTYTLVEELVKMGHEVTLFATADSKTSAKLVAVVDSQTTDEFIANQNLFLPYQLLTISEALKKQEEFDIIHNNLFETFLLSSFSSLIKKPVVHTVHNDFFHEKKWQKFFFLASKSSRDVYVFVSHNQQRPVVNTSLRSCVIHNGIDPSLYDFNEKPKDYFLWFGRIAKKKGVKDAVIAAKKANVPLVVAGVIDKEIHLNFFQNEVKPLLDTNIQTIIKPLNFKEKVVLYKNAKALLVPIHWEEPFGLTMIEAMACGTPVIAYKRAATEEIVADGKTGYLVEENNITDLVKKMKEISKIKREECRNWVEKKFTSKIMAKKYVNLYETLCKNKL